MTGVQALFPSISHVFSEALKIISISVSQSTSSGRACRAFSDRNRSLPLPKSREENSRRGAGDPSVPGRDLAAEAEGPRWP